MDYQFNKTIADMRTAELQRHAEHNRLAREAKHARRQVTGRSSWSTTLRRAYHLATG